MRLRPSLLFLPAMALVAAYTLNDIVGFGLAMGLAFFTLLLSGLRGWRLRMNSKDKLYALYAVVAIVPALRYWDPYSATFYLRVVLYPWAVSIVFQSLRLSWLHRAVWLALVLVVVYVAVGWMLFQVSPGQFDFSIGRLLTLDRSRGFYWLGDERTGPNKAAMMCVAGIAFTLASLKFRRINPMVAGAVVGTLTVLLIVAGGRIATASAVGLVGLYAIISPGRHRLRHMVVTAGLLVLFGGGVLGMYNVLSGTQGAAVEERVEGLADPLEDQNLLARFNDWARATDLIRSAPGGLGFNAYYERYERTPHNELLGQLLGGGWVGALAYFGMMAFLTWRSGTFVFRRMDGSMESHDHYLAFGLLCATWLAMLTEHISRGGMSSFYPLVWMAIGLTYARTSDREVPAAVPAPDGTLTNALLAEVVE